MFVLGDIILIQLHLFCISRLTDVPDSFYYPSTRGNNTFYRILDIHTDHEEGGHIYVGGRNRLTELSEDDLTLVS